MLQILAFKEKGFKDLESKILEAYKRILNHNTKVITDKID